MKKVNTQGKWYSGYLSYIIVLVILLLIPLITDNQVQEIDYGSFLDMVEQGEITDVVIENNVITFTDKNQEVYKTGNINNPGLVGRLDQASVKFSQKISSQSTPLLFFLLTWIFPVVIFMVLSGFIVKKINNNVGQGTGNVMSFGKSKAKMYVETQTAVTLDDVAGQEEAKEALEEIVGFLHNPIKYKEIGAKIPKGALLVGPPGTGKTLLAKAVAGEAKAPFYSISGSEFVEMFVGMGAARVRDLFKQAKEKAPCIVFIDEIDTIGKSRTSAGHGGNDEREQTLNQLLTEMDGFGADTGVVILAATNRPETLDKALLRPGRFDRRIPVELPDLIGREDILSVHAKRVKLDQNININVIARETPGASGAELANIINEAALRAIKFGRTKVTQEDLEESVETVIAGSQRKNAVISYKDKLRIAYHEVGHALVAAMQTHTAPVHKITIIPRTSGALGYTLQVDEGEQVLLSKEQALDKITTFMGGRAAEEVIFNSVTSGASNDIEQATKIARAMVTRFGMNEKFGMMALETVNNPYLGGDTTLLVSPETASQIDREVLNIIKTCHQKAVNILEENKQTLHEITKYLFEKETITGKEFMSILNREIDIARK